MANLIITVIAIALVAVASIMGAYYGGTAFLEGQNKARASTLINQASQIAAAYTMYEGQGNSVSGVSLTDLRADNYLKAGISPPQVTGMPTDYLVNTSTRVITVNLSGASGGTDICTEIRKQAQGGGPFACASADSIFTYNF